MKLSKKHLIKSNIGKSPGTLTYLGEHKDKSSIITIVEYNKDNYKIESGITIKLLKEFLDKPANGNVRWINVCGLSDLDVISEIGGMFNIHKLVLEDIVNIYQRPKAEFSDSHLFAVIKEMSINERRVKSSQLSIVLTPDVLITFQDHNADSFSIIHNRIKQGKGIIRKRGSDYLLYVLIDYMVDKYFYIMEDFNERTEALQEKIVEDPDKSDLPIIQDLKKDAQKTRHSLQPLREAVNLLLKNEDDLIAHNNLIYLRDTYDHVVHLIEMIESTRESIIALMDLHLSGISNKMNEVMKVLTIIATIFIPLTFIAGIYGMNFDNIPELHWEYGYPAIWGVMLLIGVLLGVYFKRKNGCSNRNIFGKFGLLILLFGILSKFYYYYALIKMIIR